MAKSEQSSDTRNWEQDAARWQQTAHDFMRQHPILTLSMAVASGYLAGRALSRV